MISSGPVVVAEAADHGKFQIEGALRPNFEALYPSIHDSDASGAGFLEGNAQTISYDENDIYEDGQSALIVTKERTL